MTLNVEKISTLMYERNMTNSDVGRKLGVSPQAVGCWMRGKSLPALRTFVALADLLNCSLDDLVTRDENSAS